jgi:hypothetical protein
LFLQHVPDSLRMDISSKGGRYFSRIDIGAAN